MLDALDTPMILGYYAYKATEGTMNPKEYYANPPKSIKAPTSKPTEPAPQPEEPAYSVMRVVTILDISILNR